MAIGRITYEDKIDSSVNEQDPKYKITAQDMNEIKQVFNESAEDIEFATVNLGNYKVENGVIYFKKADGTYNEQGITLAGQSSVLDGNGNVILSGNITPNDNLLTNSDFRYGVINQKGQTTYDFSSQSNGAFTIDMWYATKLKVTVYDNYIRIENLDTASHSFTNNGCSFLKSLANKYTFYAKVKQCSSGNYMWFYNREDGTSYTRQEDTLVAGDNVWTWTVSSPNDVIRKFGFSIPANGYLELYSCKMEEGSYFTGMPAWNEAEELLKCMYLFEKKVINVMCSQFNATTSFASIPYSIPKSKIPSITGKCTWVGSNTGEGIGETKITKLEAIAIQKESVDIKVTHESANFGQYSRNVFVELYIDSYSY